MAPVSLRTAVISSCGKYRYHLCRRIGNGYGPVATFIMLNPSTADALVDDPTVRKCVGFSKLWGCGELQVLNLFAYRAPTPAELVSALGPVGPKNSEYIRRTVAMTNGPVICAWGAFGGHLRQDEAVLGLIDGLCVPMCLGVTKQGRPRHPLYVPYGTELRPIATSEDAGGSFASLPSR
jgi:hypothetical protein